MFAPWLQRCCQLCSRQNSASLGMIRICSHDLCRSAFIAFCRYHFGICQMMLIHPESRWQCERFVLMVKQAPSLKSEAYLLMDEHQVGLCKLKAKPRCDSCPAAPLTPTSKWFLSGFWRKKKVFRSFCSNCCRLYWEYVLHISEYLFLHHVK